MTSIAVDLAIFEMKVLLYWYGLGTSGPKLSVVTNLPPAVVDLRMSVLLSVLHRLPSTKEFFFLVRRIGDSAYLLCHFRSLALNVEISNVEG